MNTSHVPPHFPDSLFYLFFISPLCAITVLKQYFKTSKIFACAFCGEVLTDAHLYSDVILLYLEIPYTKSVLLCLEKKTLNLLCLCEGIYPQLVNVYRAK